VGYGWVMAGRTSSPTTRQGRHGMLRFSWRLLCKTLITLLGVAVVVVGIVLMPLPGPGTLIVLVGLTILATEYHWARRLRAWIRLRGAEAAKRVRALAQERRGRRGSAWASNARRDRTHT
jgi:uncharacterized protein (TIGR02611 family)